MYLMRVLNRKTLNKSTVKLNFFKNIFALRFKSNKINALGICFTINKKQMETVKDEQTKHLR